MGRAGRGRSVPPACNKPDDRDVIRLCALLLPEMQRIVKSRTVPKDTIVHQALRGILCDPGMVPVLRSLNAQDDVVHPEGVRPTKLTKAIVDLYQDDLQRGEAIVLPKPSDEPQFPLRSDRIIRRLELSERRVFFMSSHEASDEPYMGQKNFPPCIFVDERVLMGACPFVRSAFTEKYLGNFEDANDIAIYDPDTTACRKRCVAQAKMVYLADLLASSYGRTAGDPQEDLPTIDGWSPGKLWKNTKSWVRFLRQDTFTEEDISSPEELDELCMFATFLGAKAAAITALRRKYEVDKARAILERAHPRPEISAPAAPRLRRDSPERRRRGDYEANEWENDTSDLGWRRRDR
ncbi:hypothetical protein DSL72_004359 [Monilinia vaccinii-corymbosi]|uniref:Uncharacterized protein n=1 Tax=Monilinia vaccinii-corymbosi TaxID=61207 RepID=A0A8A3P4G4_9HELO|nr:hypothetical protein DSL72_004359 [Monilinia vaccinii-corymbosi]